MKQDWIEITVGFLVLIITLVFFVFAYNSSNSIKPQGGYNVSANFDNVEGIVQGSDVMMSGIKIGYVDELKLDPKTFLAFVKLRIEKYVILPEDSRASIISSGLLGAKFISITPGSSDLNLQANDRIKYTQSAINLESLIGKFIYSSSSKK